MSLDTTPATATATLPPAVALQPNSHLGLILLGRNERGRPHASAFGLDEGPAAERAAALMGFATLVVADEHRALASSLPRGRMFESGRAFVPFCSAQTFARLLDAAGLPDTPVPARAAAKPASAPSASAAGNPGGGATGGPGAPSKPPFDWADIGIGSLVLATTGGAQEGWFEAVVVYTKADDHFELRWRDFPLDANIVRHRHQLALLHPGSVSKGEGA